METTTHQYVVSIHHAGHHIGIVEVPLGITTKTILKHFLASNGILDYDPDDYSIEGGPVIPWKSLKSMFEPIDYVEPTIPDISNLLAMRESSNMTKVFVNNVMNANYFDWFDIESFESGKIGLSNGAIELLAKLYGQTTENTHKASEASENKSH